jgi:dienelactone hydrolase
VLTAPTSPDPALPIVIMVNGGLIHRIGPNRTYVKIARALAAIGFSVLRIDLSGIGDSRPRTENLPPVQSVLADVREAMDALTAKLGADRFIMTGHCSGALISLLAAQAESRVVGAILMNPEGWTNEWLELNDQRLNANYYAKRYRNLMMSYEGWRKLLIGQADYRMIVRKLFSVVWGRISRLLVQGRRSSDGPKVPAKDTNSSETEHIRALLVSAVERELALLFLHPEGSTGQQYLQAIAGDVLNALCAAGLARITILPQSDHEYNWLASQQQLIEEIRSWVRQQVTHEQQLV